ncbi:unnamed protein product [[Candida] boidinii]|uniref:Unnamed protein product n=1 Tax=Candida boidinii TaxID=5477 RepID=A0ACB5TKW6_CANBO|nr:unnamed protein product [[Candida] boidinii]GMF54449.1 unnamed protein product [[Candida] boidinii]
MNSQINNSNEKQDIEHQFRNVFNTKEQVKAAMDYSAANSSNNGQRRCSVAAVTVPVQVPSTSSASAAAAAAAAAHHAVSVSSVSPPSSPPTASASSNVTTTSHQVKTTSSSVSGPSGCPMDTTVDEHSVEMTDSPSVCIQQNEVEMVTSTSMTKNNSTDLSIAPERSDMSLFMNTNQSMRTQFQQRNHATEKKRDPTNKSPRVLYLSLKDSDQDLYQTYIYLLVIITVDHLLESIKNSYLMV